MALKKGEFEKAMAIWDIEHGIEPKNVKPITDISKVRVKPQQHEAAEQRTVIAWCAGSRGKYPELELIFHVPNGGSRNAIEAHNLKLCGVKSGVSDLHLPVPNSKYIGLWIELKKSDGGIVSEVQKNWINKMVQHGHYACVCNGANEAINVIEKYLNNIL